MYPLSRQLIRSAGLAGILLSSTTALAIDYRAVASGDWSDPAIWSPVGVPGNGDRVLGTGGHTLVVSGAESIGTGAETAVLTLEDNAELILDSGASLTLHGHLDQRGWRSRVLLYPAAEVRFAPAAGQQFEWQQNNAGQRIEFDGDPGARAVIGLAAGAAGGWHVASVGFRDSLLAGRYGRIEDAIEPASARGWRMYLGNDPDTSVLAADHIEFLRCGEIGVFGLNAGDETRVQLNALTFRDQAEGDLGYALPAFWFDGYPGEDATPAPRAVPNSITNLVSDTGVAIRYVSGYVLDHHVLDARAGGFAHLRDGNNGGNARSNNYLFAAIKQGGSAMNLIADEVRTAYLYATADNPHGLSTARLRGDALISDYWFESNYPNQSDNGDAILTNGPQNHVSQTGAEPITVRVEHSGSIGDRTDSDSHPTLVTFNDATGIRMDIRHNYARISEGSQAVAIDENGATPAGTGLAFNGNIVVSDFPVDFGYAIGSPNAKRGIEKHAFLAADYNIYKNLADNALGKRKALETFVKAADRNSIRRDPALFDPSRDIARWDASLGGPGTAEHAIAEMKKRNDDIGFDPNYSVANLVRFVAQGHATTATHLVADDGLPIGPALHPAPGATRQPGENIQLAPDLGWGVAGRRNATSTAYMLYSEQNLYQRLAPARPFRRNLSHFIIVEERNGRWFFDNRRKLLPFETAPGDILVARLDLGADQVEMLAGQFGELNGITMGYASGDLDFTPNAWNSTRNPAGSFALVGTGFTPWLDAVAPPTESGELVNGGLEAGLAEGTTAIGMLDGWYSSNLIELWANGHRGVNSLDGGNFIDLDYEGGDTEPDRIWQDVQTVEGQRYVLSFDIRTHGPALPEGDGQAVCVKWNGRRTRNLCYNPDVPGEWKRIRIVVTGTGGLDQIQLRERIRDDANDGDGPLLDNIRFEAL